MSENLVIRDFDKFPPLYFARDNKQLVVGNLTIEIISFNARLLEIITTEFPKFLAITNFGCRSSKGYGCFLDVTTTQNVFLNYAKNYYPKIYLLNQKVKNDTWEKVVGDFYKMVKMGNNHPNRPELYKKAYLWEYFAQKGIRWEKRKIKKEFPSLAVSKNGNQPIDVENPREENFRFIRALLGLAGHYEFRTPSVEKVTITCNQSNIKRMRSPIEFKVVEDNVYLLCNDFYKKLYGKSFKFSYKGKNFDIDVPNIEEFDLYQFMDYLVERNIIKVAQ
jgi:hypothetical protein